MSYARINMVEFNSAEDAKASADDYAANAAAEFPEAEILLSVTTGAESAVVISVYPDKDAFERSRGRGYPLPLQFQLLLARRPLPQASFAREFKGR